MHITFFFMILVFFLNDDVVFIHSTFFSAHLNVVFIHSTFFSAHLNSMISDMITYTPRSKTNSVGLGNPLWAS